MVLAVCDDWLVYGPNLDCWIRLFVHRPRARRGVRALTGLPTALPPLDGAAFCFVSDFTRRGALADGWPASLEHRRIQRHRPRDFPRRRHCKPWSGGSLYVGRIDDRKGIETLIRAMPQLPEASLEIVGRGGTQYSSS